MRGWVSLRIVLLGALAGLFPGPLGAQWQPNGAPVCTAAGHQFLPYVLSDGTGGVIVTWFDEREGSGIFAQRLSAVGVPQWAPDGVPVVTGVRIIPPKPAIVSDGAGGAIVTWPDDHANNHDFRVYAQRVSAAGVTRWTPNGVALARGGAGLGDDRGRRLARSLGALRRHRS